LLLFSTGMMAQNINVSGLVTDAGSGMPLPGANIIVKGTTSGTVTNVNGEYSIEISDPNAILIFSFIGYEDLEVQVNNQSIINANLQISTKDIDELVVIGYGVQKKKLSTGATVHIKDEDIAQKHSLRVEQAIQGLTPGVQVTSNSGQPGEGLKVRIRGVGTVGNSDPLYVVDGIPTDNIAYLNPSDVESVDILKDAASAAIYGARAANGVVLITTKKGKAGEMKLTYNGYYGVQNVPNKIELLNAKEFATYQNAAAENMGDDLIFPQEVVDTMGEGTNWLDYLFNENAPTQSHSVSLTGGNETSIFSSSISYLEQSGIVGTQDKSQYERFSVRLNSEHKIYNERLKIGENVIFSHSNISGVGVGDKYDNSVRGFLNASPLMKAYDDSYEDGFGRSPLSDDESNPLAEMYFNSYDKVLGNLFAEIEIIKGLKFTSDFGIDLEYKRVNEYGPVYSLTEYTKRTNSQADMDMEYQFTYNFENYLTYSRYFGKHNITALIGNTVEEYNKFWVYGEKQDLIMDDFEFAIIDNATNDETQKTEGGKLDRALLSYYGRLNYNYNEKYLLAATLRRDGSSKFGPENRFGTFPSVSAGWVLSEEEFAATDLIDFLKLRASWGQNGNDKIPDFMYEATILSTGFDYYFGADETKYVGSAPEKIHNPLLKWETSEQLDIGFDSKFLDNFSLAFDWYKKTTKDWLVEIQVPEIAGTDPPIINGGDVLNRGYEIDLGYQKIGGDFTFSINANLAHNYNEVLFIDNEDEVIHGVDNVIFHDADEVFRAEVGYPIGYFYGYEMLGIFQDTNEINNYSHDGELMQPRAVPGDVKFKDINNDSIINEDDRTMIGNPHPDFTFGLSFSAQYKGWDFSIFMQGVAGNEILYGIRQNERPFNNFTAAYNEYWTEENPSTTRPRATPGVDPNKNWTRISALYIEDGSYLKIRSLNIGHDLKKTLLKNASIQQLRVYVSASNLYTFTKYTGFDPEVGYGDYDEDRYDNFSTGIDIGYYPVPRTYLVGLNVTF
ncbi:SusC/RagA family TonB-linked outer membrane protein, partial [Bacteroidota bacterium]